MDNDINSEIVIRQFDSDIIPGNKKYLLEVRVLFENEFFTENLPDEYIMAVMLEKLQETVFDSSIKNTIIVDTEKFYRTPVCKRCGKPLYPKEAEWNSNIRNSLNVQ